MSDVEKLIIKYNKAVEDAKILEGQYQLLQKQLSKSLMEMGLTYEEAIERGEKLKASLQEKLPAIEAYINEVSLKKKEAQELFI